MADNLCVGLMYGGRSAEHEISVLSARTVHKALLDAGFEVLLIGIDHHGRWSERHSVEVLNTLSGDVHRPIALLPGGSGELWTGDSSSRPRRRIDAVFPVLHGPNGEDGTVQGLCRLANVPCVGAGLLGAALGMDKDVCKRVLRECGIDVVDYLPVTATSVPCYQNIESILGPSLFVKPARLGSSVGVRKVRNASEYERAVEHAFQFDHKILIERAVEAREIECAVYGSEPPMATLAGEIKTSGNHHFYDYDAKYDEMGSTQLDVPAQLAQHLHEEIQMMALKACQALSVDGMARVDFFLLDDGKLLVNEVNTTPGFTAKSMYPMLCHVTGIPLPRLVEQLIDDALLRFRRDQRQFCNHDRV